MGKTIQALRNRSANMRKGRLRQLGASAVEWVVISFILVMIVTAVGFVINRALTDTAGQVSNCIDNTSVGADCTNDNLG